MAVGRQKKSRQILDELRIIIRYLIALQSEEFKSESLTYATVTERRKAIDEYLDMYQRFHRYEHNLRVGSTGNYIEDLLCVGLQLFIGLPKSYQELLIKAKDWQEAESENILNGYGDLLAEIEKLHENIAKLEESNKSYTQLYANIAIDFITSKLKKKPFQVGEPIGVMYVQHDDREVFLYAELDDIFNGVDFSNQNFYLRWDGENTSQLEILWATVCTGDAIELKKPEKISDTTYKIEFSKNITPTLSKLNLLPPMEGFVRVYKGAHKSSIILQLPTKNK